MSAEDNSSADSVDIGEALVASLGFEPTVGRKTGRKAAAADAAVETDLADDAIAARDDALAVVSRENETGPSDPKESSAGPGAHSKNGTSTNGANNSRPNSANRKKNRNRKQNKGNSGRNKSSEPTGNAGASSTTSEKDGPLDDIKSAAKPLVSGGVEPEAVSDVGSDGGEQSGVATKMAGDARADGDAKVDGAATSGTAANSGSQATIDASKSDASTSGSERTEAAAKTGQATSGSSDRESPSPDGGSGSNGGQKSKIATAAAAAVTGDLTDAVKDAVAEPPPPSAADAIMIDAPPAEPVEVEPAEIVPSAPPVKPVRSDTSGSDTSGSSSEGAQPSRSEKMAAAAKAAPLPNVDATIADSRIDMPDIDSSPAPLTKDPAPTERVDVVKVPAKPKTDLLAGGTPDLATVRNIFRRKRRVQARKVRRVIRHIDPWSVLTFSVLFHLSVFAALLLASVLVWNAAEAAGTIENLETFILELGDYETFEIKGDVVFRAAVAIAGVLTLASSVMLVLLTVVFNLISDLVGGIRLTVIEEETVRVRRRRKSPENL